MNLHQLLNHKKIVELQYDGIYTELPVPDIIDFDWKTLIDKPPDNDSSITIRELELISKLTLSRTKEQENLVIDVDQNTDEIFKNFIQKNYSIRKYPQEEIDQLYKIIKPIILNLKSLWNRPRPYQLAKLYGLNIDVINTDTHHTGSYPSGHTVYGNIVAEVLLKKYPKIQKKDLYNLVYLVAEARVLQGVHYPTDNKASLKLSKYILNKLMEK